MERWQRRAAKTIGGVLALIVLTSLLYHYVMVAVEGRSQSYFHSTQVVIETFTGTGYGSDSPWGSPLGNLFVMAMDLGTFLVLFIVVPYVFQPILEESFSPTAPRTTELADHVLVCGYSSRSERLVDEFESRGVDHLVVVEDESEALALDEAGTSVIRGDPTAVEDLERANVDDAAAVVIDTADEAAASAVLAVRERTADVRVVALCSDRSLERPLRYAGADTVVTPRHLLGRRIAERVRAEIDPRVSDVTSLGDGVSLAELSVFEESTVCGKTLAELGVLEATDVILVGLWKGGAFVSEPSPDLEIDEHTVLLVAGDESTLKELESHTAPARTSHPRVVVAGHGEVGSTISERLRAAGVACTVIDREELPGVDVVGDATDEDVLERADLQTATAFVVAVGSDDEAILSALVARELADDLDVVVRANDADSERKLRRAGADYVLTLPDISGRLLALDVLREEILSYDRQLTVVRFESGRFAGRTLGETTIPESDCILVAVERDGEIVTDVPLEFRFEADDSLLVAGDDEAIDALESGFDSAPA
ncbi:NAD-binding protein [Haloterrigena salifodinae]|uniref:NAD-binding protein n=1 Tax=Haloterrigena salifodinae TaxID=2675099 RepID=A0A8T8E2W8_9EURY|nr:NAD-binding protein [Haloterrigena salifodinae]QRV15842.1 NAD-binding protein [Haloterrigena salifodinae]